MSLSVIIPTLNSAAYLKTCLHSVCLALPEAEVIVVDGGSDDETCGIARQQGVAVLQSARGRGKQLNAGAQAAGSDVLFFLHSDSTLAAAAGDILKDRLADPRVCIGTFQLHFDQSHWLLNFYGWMTQFDSLWTRFGDQGIVIRRDFFESLGGFPDWPLFEDVHLLRLARRKTKIYSFPAMVTTSAEKFVKNGCLGQQLRNAWFIIQYLCGVAPETLNRKYEKYYCFYENRVEE